MKLIYIFSLVAVIAVTMIPGIMGEAEAEGRPPQIGIFDQIDKGMAAFMDLFKG
uniref:U13-myrmicitoxin-Tb1a n=1 Tax=Tetramorium bicarinatum TaxID=219812 RepID=TX13A_TETBN